MIRTSSRNWRKQMSRRLRDRRSLMRPLLSTIEMRKVSLFAGKKKKKRTIDRNWLSLQIGYLKRSKFLFRYFFLLFFFVSPSFPRCSFSKYVKRKNFIFFETKKAFVSQIKAICFLSFQPKRYYTVHFRYFAPICRQMS